MADKSINQLPVSDGLTDDGLLVVYQDGATRSIKGKLVREFAEGSASEIFAQAKEGAEQAEASADAAQESRYVAEYTAKIVRGGQSSGFSTSATLVYGESTTISGYLERGREYRLTARSTDFSLSTGMNFIYTEKPVYHEASASDNEGSFYSIVDVSFGGGNIVITNRGGDATIVIEAADRSSFPSAASSASAAQSYKNAAQSAMSTASQAATRAEAAAERAEAAGGGVEFETDDTLIMENGVLRVNTADEVGDSTLPITAAAVNVTVGNIEALLETI